MSVSVQPRAFADALARAMAAIENSKEHPVLGHVLLTCGHNTLTLRSTDLNVEIMTALDCEGDMEPICVPASRLQAAFARLVDRGSAQFVLDGTTLTVSSGRSRFTMPTLPADMFPSLQMGEVGCTFTMDGKHLAELFRSCGFAIADKDIGRPMLEGLHLFPGRVGNEPGRMLCAVATNGHKMGVREVPADMPDDMPLVIVPRRSVLMLEKLVAPWSETHIELSANRLVASFGSTRYSTKLIEFTYPDWRRTVPQGEAILSYDTEVLRAAVETAIAAVQADKKHNALKMSFVEDETQFTIGNTDGTAGGADACPHSLLGHSIPDVTLGLNPKYFLEAITALASDTIQIFLSDGASPIVMRSPGHSDRLAVVMPRRA